MKTFQGKPRPAEGQMLPDSEDGLPSEDQDRPNNRQNDWNDIDPQTLFGVDGSTSVSGADYNPLEVLSLGKGNSEQQFNAAPKIEYIPLNREGIMPNDSWMSIIEAHPELTYHQAEIILLVASYRSNDAQALERIQYLLDRMKGMEKLG